MKTIEIKRGDSYNIPITIQTSAGEAIDITGWEFFLTVRKAQSLDHLTPTEDDDDALIAKTWTSHTDPDGGKTEIQLLTTDTNIDPGKYAYDIQVKYGENVITLVLGDFIITADVTRS